MSNISPPARQANLRIGALFTLGTLLMLCLDGCASVPTTAAQRITVVPVKPALKVQFPVGVSSEGNPEHPDSKVIFTQGGALASTGGSNSGLDWCQLLGFCGAHHRGSA